MSSRYLREQYQKQHVRCQVREQCEFEVFQDTTPHRTFATEIQESVNHPKELKPKQ